jgi:hypothetical protein
MQQLPTVQALLGKGGTGSVYSARCSKLKPHEFECVAKVVSSSVSSDKPPVTNGDVSHCSLATQFTATPVAPARTGRVAPVSLAHRLPKPQGLAVWSRFKLDLDLPQLS